MIHSVRPTCNPYSNDYYFHLKLVLFGVILRMDGRTDVQTICLNIMITLGRDYMGRPKGSITLNVGQRMSAISGGVGPNIVFS